jgi:ubiquinone biosynthesis protein COQ9
MTQAAYDRDDDRARLLEAALDHVAFDGWSETALRAAATDTGIPIERALNAFPGGATELVAFHSETADRRMERRERVAADRPGGLRTRLGEDVSHNPL